MGVRHRETRQKRALQPSRYPAHGRPCRGRQVSPGMPLSRWRSCAALPALKLSGSTTASWSATINSRSAAGERLQGFAAADLAELVHPHGIGRVDRLTDGGGDLPRSLAVDLADGRQLAVVPAGGTSSCRGRLSGCGESRMLSPTGRHGRPSQYRIFRARTTNIELGHDPPGRRRSAPRDGRPAPGPREAQQHEEALPERRIKRRAARRGAVLRRTDNRVTIVR